MLTKNEAAARLGIHEETVVRWAEYGLVTRHAYNGHAWLYELPDPNMPVKHSSRWDRLVDRSPAFKSAMASRPATPNERGVV
jgi:predicted site-specific integrase-resolvase